MDAGLPASPQPGSAGTGGERTVSLGVAVAIVAAIFVVVAGIATLIGYRFFWEKYSSPTWTDIELANWTQRLKQNPKDEAALTGLGVALFQKGEFEQAEAQLKKALKVNPDNPAAGYYLGLIYEQKKQWGEAEKLFKKLAEKYPNNPMGIYELAKVYFEQGKLDAALEKLDFINANIDGTLSEVHYLAGQIYEKKNQKAKAIAGYRKAAELDPNFQPAVEALKRLGVKDIPQMPKSGAHK